MEADFSNGKWFAYKKAYEISISYSALVYSFCPVLAIGTIATFCFADYLAAVDPFQSHRFFY
jgi:hypothetical protein